MIRTSLCEHFHSVLGHDNRRWKMPTPSTPTLSPSLSPVDSVSSWTRGRRGAGAVSGTESVRVGPHEKRGVEQKSQEILSCSLKTPLLRTTRFRPPHTTSDNYLFPRLLSALAPVVAPVEPLTLKRDVVATRHDDGRGP